jgi:hypothetical protein
MTDIRINPADQAFITDRSLYSTLNQETDCHDI